MFRNYGSGIDSSCKNKDHFIKTTKKEKKMIWSDLKENQLL